MTRLPRTPFLLILFFGLVLCLCIPSSQAENQAIETTSIRSPIELLGSWFSLDCQNPFMGILISDSYLMQLFPADHAYVRIIDDVIKAEDFYYLSFYPNIIQMKKQPNGLLMVNMGVYAAESGDESLLDPNMHWRDIQSNASLPFRQCAPLPSPNAQLTAQKLDPDGIEAFYALDDARQLCLGSPLIAPPLCQKAFFDIADRDGDRILNAADLAKLYKQAVYLYKASAFHAKTVVSLPTDPLPKEDLEAFAATAIEILDNDGSGTLDFEEIQSGWQNLQKNEITAPFYGMSESILMLAAFKYDESLGPRSICSIEDVLKEQQDKGPESSLDPALLDVFQNTEENKSAP